MMSKSWNIRIHLQCLIRLGNMLYMENNLCDVMMLVRSFPAPLSSLNPSNNVQEILYELNSYILFSNSMLWTEKHIYIYTGCPRRNVPDFGRVILMLKYTDITQNTDVQSWTVTKIMAREVWDFDSCYTLIDYQIHIKTGRNVWFL